MRSAASACRPSSSPLLAGLAILGGAFLLSWATELAERDIPQSLALLVLALVSVLPEYAVDLHFAWAAGRSPVRPLRRRQHDRCESAADRPRLGGGGAGGLLSERHPELLILDPRHRLEIRFLLLATLYSFVIPLNGYINLFDAAVLLGLFLWYVFYAAATRGHPRRWSWSGPSALVDREFE